MKKKEKIDLRKRENKKELNSITTLRRVDKTFSDELESIKDERKTRGIDNKRCSDRELTKLIIKHNGWKIMKEDMINYPEEKLRGKNE